MDDDLRDALLSTEARLNQRSEADRGGVMARLDRMENKLDSIDAQWAVNIGQTHGVVVDLDSRREQLELLQGVMRAGMAPEG